MPRSRSRSRSQKYKRVHHTKSKKRTDTMKQIRNNQNNYNKSRYNTNNVYNANNENNVPKSLINHVLSINSLNGTKLTNQEKRFIKRVLQMKPELSGMNINNIEGKEFDLYGLKMLLYIEDNKLQCEDVLELRAKDKEFYEWFNILSNFKNVYSVLLKTDNDLNLIEHFDKLSFNGDFLRNFINRCRDKDRQVIIILDNETTEWDTKNLEFAKMGHYEYELWKHLRWSWVHRGGYALRKIIIQEVGNSKYSKLKYDFVLSLLKDTPLGEESDEKLRTIINYLYLIQNDQIHRIKHIYKLLEKEIKEWDIINIIRKLGDNEEQMKYIYEQIDAYILHHGEASERHYSISPEYLRQHVQIAKSL